MQLVDSCNGEAVDPNRIRGPCIGRNTYISIFCFISSTQSGFHDSLKETRCLGRTRGYYTRLIIDAFHMKCMVSAGSAGTFLSLACNVFATGLLCPTIPSLATYRCICRRTLCFVLTHTDIVSHDLIRYRRLLMGEYRPSCPGYPHNANSDKANNYLVHCDPPFAPIVE
jgi:hypothetical protein